MTAEQVLFYLTIASALRRFAVRASEHSAEMKLLAGRVEQMAMAKRNPTVEEIAEIQIGYLAVSDSLDRLATQGPTNPVSIDGR